MAGVGHADAGDSHTAGLKVGMFGTGVDCDVKSGAHTFMSASVDTRPGISFSNPSPIGSCPSWDH